VGGSTAFGQSSAASSSRFGASSPSTGGSSVSQSWFGGSSAAGSSSSGFGQSAGTVGFGQSPSSGSSTGFGANPMPPAVPGSGSASMDRPTFEQPAAPQSPQSPQVPQVPQAPAAPQEPVVSVPKGCFSADANRISMAKCPQADAQNKCVNMPNCVWGLDQQSASAAAAASVSANVNSKTVLSAETLDAEGDCLWDMEGALESVDSAEGAREAAANAVQERQQTICASYDVVECEDAAKGLKEALCFWRPRSSTQSAQTRILDNVHRAVVSAMNTKVSALDLLLGVAFMITAAFGMHQFQQWLRTRDHSKNGRAAKAEWQDQGMQIPIF